MTINIKLPRSKQDMEGTGDRPIIGNNTQVFNDKGDEITGIREIDISIRLDAIVTATVEVMVNCDSDMDNVHALLGTSTLADILKLHGIDAELIDKTELGNPYPQYVLGDSAKDGDYLPPLKTGWIHKPSNCEVVVISIDRQKGGVVVQVTSPHMYTIWDKSEYLFCKFSDLMEIDR